VIVRSPCTSAVRAGRVRAQVRTMAPTERIPPPVRRVRRAFFAGLRRTFFAGLRRAFFVGLRRVFFAGLRRAFFAGLRRAFFADFLVRARFLAMARG